MGVGSEREGCVEYGTILEKLLLRTKLHNELLSLFILAIQANIAFALTG